MKKKKLFRAFLALTLAITATFGSACDKVFGLFSDSSQVSSSESSSEYSKESSFKDSSFEYSSEEDSSLEDSSFEYSSEGDSSLEDSSSDESSSGGDSSDSSNSSDSSDVPTETPPKEPTEVRREVDCIGHEVIYYEDGTYKDNGRVVDLDFRSPAPATQNGYLYFSEQENGEGICSFYEDLYALASEFHTSSKTVTDINGMVGEVDYAKHGLTQSQAYAVWSTFRMENPAFYWIDNSVIASSEALKLLCFEEYYEPTVRESVWESVQAFALDCDRYLSGKTTEAERALTIFEYLVHNVEYAYQENGAAETAIWAHNITGGALYNKGVCETYAKTMDYFCGLFGLECITVAGEGVQGFSSEAHGWNMVKVDGEWYNADPTWADKKYGKTLLVNREWFGTDAVEFEKTHKPYTPNDDWKEDFNPTYQCGLPTASQGGLVPVLLSENGGENVLYNSVDKALENMVNEGSRYEMTLYPTTRITEEESLKIYPYGAMFDGALPKVKEIKISAERCEIGEDGNQYFLPMITSKNDLLFMGNVTLEDVRLYAPSVDINRYTLTTKGWQVTVQVDETLVGDGNSLVLVETGYQTNLDTVAITKAEIMDGELHFTGGGEVKEIYMIGGTVRFVSESDMTVESLWANDTRMNVWVMSAKNDTDIRIKNIYGQEAHAQTVHISIQFGDLDEYPRLALENADCVIVLGMLGSVSWVTTDYEGNVVSKGEREVDPADLTMPIANIGNIGMDGVEITYYIKGVGTDKTFLYEKDENNDVCLKN